MAPEIMQGGSVEPGRALSHEFEMLDQLGPGGLGMLNRARDRASGELLALRLTEIPDVPPVRDAFGELVALHKRLSGVPLARIRSCGGTGQLLWYAMDLLQGQSLHALVLYGRNEVVTAEAVRLVIEAADAVAHLHDEGVVHQDLNPRNLFVVDGHVQLLEVGVAPAVARLVRERPGLITTPRLRASEQLVSPTSDRRTDIYALGMVLYFLLTRRTGIGKGPQLLRLATDGGVPPPKLDNVPNSVRPVLQRALAMRPTDRFASAGELATALRSVRS
jgi:serine/threonine protein kinase